MQAATLMAAKGAKLLLPAMAQHAMKNSALTSALGSVDLLAPSTRMTPAFNPNCGQQSTFASTAVIGGVTPQVLPVGDDMGTAAPTPTGLPAEAGKSKTATVSYLLMHPTYRKEYSETVKVTHLPTDKVHQKLAFFTAQAARRFFDLASGYSDTMTEAKWLQRIVFLETIAGVPGMVGGMLRHMKSLRTMERDNGWIHTLLEEAENERMHLLTFLKLRQPGPLFRGAVIVSQGLFFNIFLLAYLIWPRACHSFVGYLEEEAVRTYTHCLKDIDAGLVWKDQAVPEIAMEYWKLPPGSTMRDLVLAVRADEACHRDVNHTFAGMKSNEPNPFGVGNHMVP